MKIKITLLTVTLTFFGWSNIAKAQWTPTAHTSGTTGCLTTIGADVFVGESYPFSGIYKISNDGATVTTMSTGLPSNSSVYSIITVGNAMYAGTDGGVYKSTDNGSNWSSSGLDSLLINSMTSNSTGIFAATYQSSGGVFLSTDNGSSWTAVNTGLPVETTNRLIASNGTALLVATSIDVYRSTDDGANWTAISSLNYYSMVGLAVNGTTFYAGTTGNVYVSTDNGINWTNSNFSSNHIKAFAFTGTNVFAGSFGGGVGLSTNGGAFTAQNTGLNYNNVKALAICGNYLYSGADGGGVWKRALSEMGVSVGIMEFKENENLVVYPSPSDGKFEINSQAIKGEISIYNVVGEKIYQSEISSSQSIIDISDQPQGIYFLKIFDGTKIYTKKTIVQ